MSKQYQARVPFCTPAEHLPKKPVKGNGVKTYEYPERGNLFYCSAVAWVGTRTNINDLSTEKDTLTVETWYTPDIKKDDRILLLDDNSVWEVETKPENINRKGQFMRFKVVAIGG